MILQNDMPQAPKITQEQLEECRKNGDYCPILFEWYKFVGELCGFLSCIRSDSAALRSIDPLHYAIIIGLLNRCARLMLSNIVLSHGGLHGETTSIIDRCIFESSIKINWLCRENSKDKFNQFLADGLKTELHFKEKINKNINARKSKLVIEERMLDSIEHCILSSKLTEEEIKSIKKLPPLSVMINDINDDLLYMVGQKIGSHHIHGTWPSLMLHYLQSDKSGFYAPRDHNCETNVNQYVIISFLVLQAMQSFIQFIFSEKKDVETFLQLFVATQNEIVKINKEVIGNDFEFSDI